jgi:hypothetical protein
VALTVLLPTLLSRLGEVGTVRASTVGPYLRSSPK